MEEAGGVIVIFSDVFIKLIRLLFQILGSYISHNMVGVSESVGGLVILP